MCTCQRRKQNIACWKNIKFNVSMVMSATSSGLHFTGCIGMGLRLPMGQWQRHDTWQLS
jgi:hypothetical protein